jgi:hypothetical protein
MWLWLMQLVGFMTWSFGLSDHVISSSHKWHIWLDFCTRKCTFWCCEPYPPKYELMVICNNPKHLSCLFTRGCCKPELPCMLLLVYIMVVKFFCSLIYVTSMVYFESVHFHGNWGCLVDKVLGFMMPWE